MSGVKLAGVTAELDTTATLKTLFQLVAAANHRVLVKEWSISFKGTSNTNAPILVQVFRQTSAGTMSANTLVKINLDDDETIQTTALDNATVEPIKTNSIHTELVHPQGGYTWQASFGNDIVINGGDRLGWVVTAADAVNGVVSVKFEE